MAQIAYRANLSSSVFPMTLADAGRAVIIPGPDQNYDRRVDPTGEQKTAGIPQAIFLSDVMPTPEGYQSVGYKSGGTYPDSIPAGSSPVPFASLRFYFGDFGAPRTIHVFLRSGTAGYLDGITSALTIDPVTWDYLTAVTDPQPPADSGITQAYVRGVNYVFDGYHIFRVDQLIDDVLGFVNIDASITGVAVADIIAICACANYLILLLKDGTVAWSSTTTPTDFVASLVSGAGSTIPSALQGPVRFLVEAPNAFYIYTIAGVIYAQYTGNARYPFKFTPVADSGSYTYLSQVALNPFSDSHYAIDNSNQIHRITPRGSEVIAPEVTTFMERQKRYDLFDNTANTFSLASYNLIPDPAGTRSIYYCFDRYILLPAGVYIYVYDVLLQRYGRLKQAGFVVQSAVATGSELFFFDSSSFNKLTFDIYNTSYTFSGVLAVGRFQYARSRKIKLEEIEFEGPPNTDVGTVPSTSCVVLPCQDGRNFDAPITPYTSPATTGGLSQYLLHNTAQNHTVILKGAFSVNTLQLKFTPAGDR